MDYQVEQANYHRVKSTEYIVLCTLQYSVVLPPYTSNIVTSVEKQFTEPFVVPVNYLKTSPNSLLISIANDKYS